MEARLNNFASMLSKMPSITREGLLIHAMRMSSNAKVLLLPRQLAYYYEELPSQVSATTEATAASYKPVGFVCGVSGRNQLPTVNFCQDIRAWRARLERGGINVVKAASFSGRSLRDYTHYARRIGYPVVLKPVIRNTLFEEHITGIDSDSELKFLFRQTREMRKQSASDLAASPYAMTRLSEDHVDEHGRLCLPLGVRYMVEQQRVGQSLRLIIAQGKVVSALSKPSGSDDWLQTTKLHDSYFELGAKIADILQGMAFLRVDLIIDDPTTPADKAQDTYAVIAISEHLKCYGLLENHPDMAWDILQQVAECQKPNVNSHIAREVELSGVSNGERLKQELTEAATLFGIDIDLQELDQVTGRVKFSASGPLWALAGLTWSYANGLGIDEVPTSVTIQ